MLESFILRKPEKEDALAILECHREAIVAKASAFYDPRIIEVWAAITDELIRRVEQEIAQRNWIYILAENPQKGIIGFGIAIPEKHELRAVYVSPNPCEKVGTKILAALLAQAKAAGCSYLEADGSVNSEKFYLNNGFRILSRGAHRMSTGDEMACTKMRIDLK